MSILNHFQDLSLTNDQHQALVKVETFLKSNANIFLLKGYAGTGKTTLLKGIADYLQSERQTCDLMAPTGRAAMVISSKTKSEATTIHRAIYNYDEIEDKENDNSFYINLKLNLNENSINHVTLVDEASMVSDVFSDDEFFIFGSGYLLKDLFDYTNFKGDNNRKIIFVGDDAQLPPVGMNFSPALCTNYLREKYNLKIEEFTLGKVVRQQEHSGILKCATAIRKQIDANEFNRLSINPNQKDIVECKTDNFNNTFLKTASKIGIDNSIIITHSNNLALEYNKIIRDLRYGHAPGIIREKDKLIITKNNYNYHVKLYNGMFAKVLNVGEIEYAPQVVFKIKGGKTISRKLSFRRVTLSVKDIKGKKHTIHTTILDYFLLERNGKIHPYDQRAIYVDFKNRMRDKGIRPKTEEFKQALRADIYFNAVQAKYGYAITCHKAQGGEWKKVFVDFNVFMGKTTLTYYRWVYTAITRSNDTIFTIDAPSFDSLSEFKVNDKIEFINKIPKDLFYVPDNNQSFIEHRKNKLKEICLSAGINIEFIEGQNQLRTCFESQEKTAEVILWYNKHAFSKTNWNSYTDDDFRTLVSEILKKSLIPDSLKFEYKFDFQKELHDYFITILKDLEITLLNVSQLQWSDRYFVITEAECAYIEFSFNKKKFYSSATLKSTLGEKDGLLVEISKILEGEKI